MLPPVRSLKATGNRWASAALLIAAALLLPGCGEEVVEGRIEVIPVQGQLLVKGQPAPGARVTLHPVDGPVAEAGLYPYGIVDESGAFSVTTYQQGDGAPPGEYRVSVVWPDANYQARNARERDMISSGAQLPDKLRGRYADPQRTGLTATITPDTTELPAINLK